MLFRSQVLKLITLPADIGRSFFAAPGVPAERLTALRAAFDAMAADPAMLAEAKRRAVTIGPWSGVRLTAFLAEISKTPPGPIAMLKSVLE